jgi:Tfp pilus assembly protein PilX
MRMMKKTWRRSERGVALIMTLLALLILSAIPAALVYSTNTESQVNFNYRSEQVAYFGAKAGLEEARDRMMLGLAGGYYFANMVPNPVPTSAPADGTGQVLYILNEGGNAGSVQPWTSGSAYMDDELCHDGYALTGLTNVPSDVHCSTVPSTTTWYTKTAAQLPFNGTSGTLAYKWVRVALKLNNSVLGYPVNGTATDSSLVCWNGSSEVVLTAASCDKMAPAATPVYLVTSLGVSSTGARKMVQADVAMNPSTAFPYGMYGTGTGCGDVTFAGNAVTDSFDSSKGNYAGTKSNNGGDVGSNGNVAINGNNATIGGMLGVLPQPGQTSVVAGLCPGSNYTPSASGNTGFAAGSGNGVQALSAPVTFTTPPAPVPAPPTTALSYTSSASMVPGTYGNISLSGGPKVVLTMAPGVYNINTIAVAGQATIQISPPGQVVLNVAGSVPCLAPCLIPPTVIDMEGGSLTNATGLANDFQINYGGNYGVTVAGGASTYLVVNTPNAAVSLVGNGDVYGAILGKTINVAGNGKFHYDKAVKLAPPSTGALQLLSFRHIAY